MFDAYRVGGRLAERNHGGAAADMGHRSDGREYDLGAVSARFVEGPHYVFGAKRCGYFSRAQADRDIANRAPGSVQ